MTENEISKVVVDAALKVHRELGPGLLYSIRPKADIAQGDILPST